AARVAQAREIQRQRCRELARGIDEATAPRCNAEIDGQLLDQVATPDAEGRALLTRAAERLGLSARGWHRVLRVARTLADLDGAVAVRRLHIAEALSWRHPSALRTPAPSPLQVAAAE